MTASNGAAATNGAPASHSVPASSGAPGTASSAAPVSVHVHVHGRTDVGRTREHNEDAFVIAHLGSGVTEPLDPATTHRLAGGGVLLMVADGLGGAAAGELASAMAVDAVLDELRSRWRDGAPSGAADLADALRAAGECANARLFHFGTAHPEHRGMATTATIAIIHDFVVYVAQVGDSRAYLVRGGVAWQLTRDQSLVQRLVEAGELTPEEAEQSERRHIILQALGPEPAVQVDLSCQPLRRGDVVLLCSDGLSGMVRADEIAAAAAERDLAVLCTRLVALANERGGTDNITVVAARMDGDDVPVARADEPVGYAACPRPDAPAAEPITDGTPLSAARALLGASPPAPRERADRVNRLLLLAVAATLLIVALLLGVRG